MEKNWCNVDEGRLIITPDGAAKEEDSSDRSKFRNGTEKQNTMGRGSQLLEVSEATRR